MKVCTMFNSNKNHIVFVIDETLFLELYHKFLYSKNYQNDKVRGSGNNELFIQSMEVLCKYIGKRVHKGVHVQFEIVLE